MATTTDVLETVFRITGFGQFASTMAQAANAAQTFAAAQAAAAAGTLTLAGAASTLIGPILLIVGALALLTAGFDLVTKALKAFSEESKKLFSTSVVLKNLGSSLTGEDVRRFADQVSRQTGIQRPEIEEGASQIARTGIAGPSVVRALKAAADATRAFDMTFEEASTNIAKGILGSERGLKAFGATLQDTGSRAANLELIMQQINLRAQNAAAAFRETLPGAMDAAAAA